MGDEGFAEFWDSEELNTVARTMSANHYQDRITEPHLKLMYPR